MALKYYVVFLSIFWVVNNLYSIKIDRVILATDLHENYVEFWPIVAKAWQRLIGVKPTLAFIAPASAVIDETVGEVIRFEPIDGIPTSFQAQVIRLLLPALFENEVSIVSDMDMIPLSKDYFVNSVAKVAQDCFVVYRDKAYGPEGRRYPMCYVAARGKTFKDVFRINTRDEFTQRIKRWYSLNIGWSTDEYVLYCSLHKWPLYETHCVKLGHDVQRRIDRTQWQFDYSLLKNHYYIDAHVLRPYHTFTKEIDALLSVLDLDKAPSEQLQEINKGKKSLYQMLHPKKGY